MSGNRGNAATLPIPGPGVKTLYRPEMNEHVTKLALLGLNDVEMAQFFGVSRQTLDAWKSKHPAFLAALMDGRENADANVARSLYHRALGQVTTQERVVRDENGKNKIIELKTQQPSDPGAAKLWLTNRQRSKWRESTHVEQSGTVEHVHKIEREIVEVPRKIAKD